MAAETLRCPMCGAPASSDATSCQHCGARLATVACPSCFGMMFIGDKFCPHCGAQAARAEVPAGTREVCPRCKVDLEAVVIGNTSLRECARCEGIWASADALQQICADREKQAVVLGMASHIPAAAGFGAEEKVHYLPCPVCQELMNRVNFAHCSHVVVNVCNKHGTWFDKDQLRLIVEFIRAGGLEAARAREISALEQERHEARTAHVAGAWDLNNIPTARGSNYDLWGTGIAAAASLLLRFLK